MRANRLKPAAAAALLGALLLSCVRAEEPKDQKQIETTSSPPQKDAQVAEKDFLDHLKDGSKYFQFDFPSFDQYKVAELDEELGEKKTGTGSDMEKLKDKVRWGDKFGTYGEHYFDFNHGGGGGGGGDGGSDDVAPKAADDADEKKEKLTQKTNQSSDAHVEDPARDRRNLLGNADVEFISDAAREKIISGATGMHGGNYKTEEIGRVKRQDAAAEFPDAVALE